jgi:hypothetical protein
MATSFENKIAILADLWLNYRNDEEFLDFIEYNDLGLPLAYALDNSIVDATTAAKAFIDETFELLLDGLDIEDEEDGFETLDDILGLESEFDSDLDEEL